MTRVRVDMMVSLDGCATTTDQTPENPFGDDWGRLTAHYAATRTFRARVLGDATGAGTTGLDDEQAAAYFDGIGAELMGAGMFGLHAYPDDTEWRGWWGDAPPFGYPVYVLTHRADRAPIRFDNGTEFRFIDAAPDVALAVAREAAGDADVRIGGGPTTVRPFLTGGLVDELRLMVVPIVLGRGLRIWDGLRGLENDYAVQSRVAESGVVHITFTRR